MNTPRSGESTNIVFYDGLCGLCDQTVQFLLKRDSSQLFKFAPLQGETANRRTDLPGDLRSIAFVTNHGTAQEQLYLRSEAVLRILKQLGGFWRVVSWLRIVPCPLRDAIYNGIAQRRYRWFGKFDMCHAPPPENRGRFLP
jgi:predicted DCC family thiol-disulfide oxidoreductase YuxK